MAVFSNLRSRLKKRVQGALAEPAWSVTVHGRGWLCPFCADVGVAEIPEDAKARVEAILDHLVDGPCPDLHLGEGTPRPLAELRREATFRELRRRVKRDLARNASWQLMDARRRWFCPFCGDATDIEIPKDRTMTEEVLRLLCVHVENCYSYAHGKGQEKSATVLKAAVKGANRQKKVADDVRKKLEGDPLWRQKDAKARWICPFCARTLDHIDLSTNLLMFENAPALIAQHLLAPCEPWRSGQAPRQVGSAQATPATGMTRIIRSEALPLAGNGGQRRSGSGANDTERTPVKTLRDRESSGDFHLIDDPEVKKLTGSSRTRAKAGSSSQKVPDAESSASVEWRREIERELAAVRSAVPGALEHSGSLEDTEQADAREAARVAEGLPGFELSLLVRPAHPARGDFAEVVRLDAKRLGLIVGGVTSEDHEGALVAAMARNLIRIHARSEPDPAQVLRNVNAEVHQDLDARTFVAAIYAIVDGSRRTLTIARAGLAAPILVNLRRDPALSLLEAEGMVMGIDKGPIFDATIIPRTIELATDDLVCFATNGVLEIRNRNREELGLERFHAAVKRFGTHEAEYLTHKLGQLLADFTKETELSADACVLAVKLSERSK